MASRHRHGQLRGKVKAKYPVIHIDHESDFASIKIAPGVEAKSYVLDGFVFCEDKKGNVIEVQVMNLSALAKKKSRSAA